MRPIGRLEVTPHLVVSSFRDFFVYYSVLVTRHELAAEPVEEVVNVEKPRCRFLLLLSLSSCFSYDGFLLALSFSRLSHGDCLLLAELGLLALLELPDFLLVLEGVLLLLLLLREEPDKLLGVLKGLLLFTLQLLLVRQVALEIHLGLVTRWTVANRWDTRYIGVVVHRRY